MARSLIASVLYPACLAGSVGLAWALLAAGWSPTFALAAVAPAAVVCVAAERWLPHAASWQPSRDDVVTDVGHTIVSQIGAGFAGGLALQGLAQLVAPGLAIWPGGLPLAVQLVVALVVAELAQYGWHRACHASPLLWRLHATHHSPRRLYWLSSSRFHPLEVAIGQIVILAPVALTGASAELLALAAVAGTVNGMLQHANAALRLGPLEWIFSGPALHRWHHARSAERDRNYGGLLIVWDVVFGTRYAPRSAELQELGLVEPARFPTSYTGQLMSPLRWDQMKE